MLITTEVDLTKPLLTAFLPENKALILLLGSSGDKREC